MDRDPHRQMMPASHREFGVEATETAIFGISFAAFGPDNQSSSRSKQALAFCSSFVGAE
ncbi:hypothetical protein FORC36_3502 [Vibrio vulnificus]|nr:hypothetical protein VVMO6_03606 [Vibrio vulnificus MO6-24/O]ANN28604.1 hypothetical protein FORC17_3541 [Vibrio vulnificus]ARN68019.1 hypothetical protein FORC36_3502 [Vibrio vulnificus]QBH29085.1 hypothetical protein FORC77_3362 [Vibrio vulnificus]